MAELLIKDEDLTSLKGKVVVLTQVRSFTSLRGISRRRHS